MLLIEQHGKRLTPLPDATRDDLMQATARLPELLKLMPSRDVRHKLTVETWNDQPVTATIGKDLLEQAGFVPRLSGDDVVCRLAALIGFIHFIQ